MTLEQFTSVPLKLGTVKNLYIIAHLGHFDL